MKSYNFDTLIDRQGTNTVAIDGQKATFGRDGLMPLWVADMDFETPSFIVEALQQRLNHHLYGYTIKRNSLNLCSKPIKHNFCGNIFTYSNQAIC